MQQKTSIARKLIAYFLLLNILTVVVVSSYSYYRAKDALVKRTFDQLTSLRIEKKYRIERFFNDKIIDLGWISKTDEVKVILDIIGEKINGSSRIEKVSITEYENLIKKHFFSDNSYTRFYVINTSGNAVYFNISQDEISKVYSNDIVLLPINQLYTSILKKPEIIINDFKAEIGKTEPAIFIGAPIFNELKQVIGVVAFEININSINSIMFENNPHNGLGESGESYLVGGDYLMRSTSRFHDNSVFKTVVNTEGVNKALSGETGTGVIKDYRGVEVLSSYGTINVEGLNWAVLSEIDEKEAMVPIDSIRNNILYLSVLMSLLLFAFVYIIARRISLPIVKLKDAAQNITSGNYDVFVEDIVSNDEIGSLIDAFNEMSSKIKEQTENLKLERSMRLSSMIDGQELERQRLSRELHDGLGQSILAIKMRLERMSNATPEKAKEIMSEVQQLFVNTINEVRSISNDLMPAVLSEFGLIDALSNLCRDVSKSTGIDIKFIHEDFNTTTDDKIKTYLYRISQEALNNIIKHSDAKSAVFDLKCKKDFVELAIVDNGKGFDYSGDRKMCGNGISNMKERVNLLGGKINIESNNEFGTIINITIPNVT